MRFTYQTGAQPLAGYTIQRGIHRGGFGEVYYGHSDGGKEVALKLLHEQDQDVEIRGVTQCLNLKHPNLVNLFDVKTDAVGNCWVVMEYVSGSSLEDVLASFPDGLPLSEVRDWLCGLVAGTAHLHDRAIVHRDLKPANVYRENGVVKVGDVGLSKRLESDHRKQHTQSVGTVYYMAPEVAKGQYGPEVDVYSLGVMLYEMITGRVPFNGETTAEILMKHLTAQPDLTPIPKSLRPAIARALEKDPRKRTPTVRQLERDFLRGSNQSEPETIPESAFLPPVPPLTNGHARKDPSPWISISVNRPLPHRPTHFDNSRPRASQSSSAAWNPIYTIAIVFIVLWFTGFGIAGFRHGPHMQPRWFGVVVAAAVVGGVFFLQRKSRMQPSPTVAPAPRPVARPQTRPRYQTVSYPHANRADTDSQSAENSIDPKLAWSSSMGSAAFIATFLSAAVYLVLDTMNRSAIMPSLPHAAYFAATAVLGSWLVLTQHSLTLDQSWTKQQRFFSRLLAGVLLGTCAYWLHQFLLIDFPYAAQGNRAIFSRIGAQSLTAAANTPSWLGFACFFALFMGVRRSSRDLNHRRNPKISFWRTAAAVAIGFGVSFAFTFPQWYAVLWAGTISATVQMASAWTPRSTSIAGGSRA